MSSPRPSPRGSKARSRPRLGPQPARTARAPWAADREPSSTRPRSRRLGLAAELTERLTRLQIRDAGHGFDSFGLNADWVAGGLAVFGLLYERYFRVLSYGADKIPARGAVILAANHSGTLPFDGMMLWQDVIRHTDPPRVPRAVADLFVPGLPFVGNLFSRLGVVGGSRGNVRDLLESGECLMIFPEGTVGIGKPFSQRYKLQEWRVGHAELAIRHGATVVPVGIVGAEEQMPQLGRLPIEAFGAPYLPVPLTLFPLPVRYHIHYGDPIELGRQYRPAQADEPSVVREAAARVKASVAALLERGLADRAGIFT
jgi:1-acyl-sn-glycerol-3-phosphate acyltransferase